MAQAGWAMGVGGAKAGHGRYRLWHNPGWGSALVEMQLVWYGLPHELIEAGDIYEDVEARQRLAGVNARVQVPTLVLPDGQVMTESAAITLYLADLTGRDDLVPGPGAAERAAFLRWLVFIVANIYPTFTFADVPTRFVRDEAAAKGFRSAVEVYAQTLWREVAGAAGEPWFLGERFSVLDIYVAVMNHWRPRGEWFAAETPGLAAIARRVEAMPELAEAFRRNFG